MTDFLLFGASSEPRNWLCSTCKYSFRWNDQAGYYGNLECLDCGRAALEAVFCSTICRQRHDKAKAQEEALDLCDYCKGKPVQCKSCDGRWHACPLCNRAPANFMEATASDENLAQFFKEHPLNSQEKDLVQRMVWRLQDRLRKKPV